MSQWIDLTVLIDETYLEYPGDIPFSIEKESTFKKDGLNMARLSTNMHIGTHIDAPKHAWDLEEGIESIDFKKCIGRATIVEPRIKNHSIETQDIIEQYDSKDRILIIKTNHSTYLHSDKYYEHPVFQKDVLDFLIKNHIEVIAFDMPSPKYKDESFMEMHKDLLKHNILIIENLTNLDTLDKYIDFIALPLKIKGLDGSLTRCIGKNRKHD